MKEVALIGMAQSLFFMVIVLLKKDKHLKDYLLMSFFFFIGCELTYRYLLKVNVAYYNSLVVLCDIIYWAMFGPVLLFYIRSVINKSLKFKIQDLVHLIPLIISLIAILKYSLNRNNYSSFIEYYNLQTGLIKVGLLIWEFTSAVYILYAIIILFKHRVRVKNYFSSIEKKKLSWLLFLTLGFAIYIYSSYVYWILRDVFDLHMKFKFIDILALLLTIYVFGLGIFGYKQDGVFFENELSIINNDLENNRKPKYQKTGLTSDEKESLNKKLVEVMQKEKPFLESEITINNLADQVGTSIHKLSQVINEEHKKNFFDFINSYRIDEVKKLLSDSTINDLKIESLAYDCGFNSKSSFYAIFKKHTHLTPTEYRKRTMQSVYI